ncbi:NAD-dependent epimerase/dehydratase family protein [Phycisphaera mikurensis]|uniref:NAD-dependent epimerase/dehydratase family protein n=1 Tax=Phycisphaera mikurensis (strain NBRC 102666 / KCTC 22515 / FYK2301M01) TaxID=1142394 RepID=I0IHB7_PHYMF|nr:NAD(P)-dependent oxidoreductase [Phycisphaera mikurensis]MBB6440904.1 nucleoside-diphosphate-sugar epimerase [Phycisphaera mikurensis]BAM04655.1 NAD-dependent epimerase/dehydratase family protein [Phycisphaera mikurensis NBRC 102666]
MRVLVTGAAGLLGSAAIKHLHAAGHGVVATDQRHAAGLPVPLHQVDLADDMGVYNLFHSGGGVDAVLHLGNIPNPNQPLPRQKLLAANVGMTANVLYAAGDHGVERIVYASSIQATMDMVAWPKWFEPQGPCPFPRLPMDGNAPAAPGQNPYALSKAHGEQLLAELCRANAKLAGVALRLPGICGRTGWNPPRRPFHAGCHELIEGMALLHLDDACRLFEAALLRSPPGYRCHFPASCRAVAGIAPATLAREFLPHIPVTGDLRGPGGLADLGVLRDELGWTPLEPTPLLWPKA